jgi:hypothetical protein
MYDPATLYKQAETLYPNTLNIQITVIHTWTGVALTPTLVLPPRTVEDAVAPEVDPHVIPPGLALKEAFRH